jgi:hypothetical protein
VSAAVRLNSPGLGGQLSLSDSRPDEGLPALHERWPMAAGCCCCCRRLVDGGGALPAGSAERSCSSIANGCSASHSCTRAPRAGDEVSLRPRRMQPQAPPPAHHHSACSCWHNKTPRRLSAEIRAVNLRDHTRGGRLTARNSPCASSAADACARGGPGSTAAPGSGSCAAHRRARASIRAR